MGICSVPGISLGCGAIASATKSAASSVLDGLARAAASALAETLKLLTAGFLDVKTPNLASGAGSPVAFVQGSLQDLTIAAAVLGLIVAATRMVWARRNAPAREALAGLLRLLIVSGAGVALISLMSAAGDQFSTWIVGQSTADPTASISTLGTVTAASFTSPFLLLIVAGFAIAASLVQLVLLLVRSSLLIVLAGVLPFSAGMAMLGPAGAAAWRKVSGWIVAMLLFKPVAAILLATALRQMTTATSPLGTLEGTTLLCLGVVALPATMRLIQPMVAAVGGMGAAEALGGVAAGVATGAAVVAGGGAGLAAVQATHQPGLVSKAGVGSAPDGAKTAPTPPTSGGGAKAGAQAAQTVFTAAHETVEKMTGQSEGKTS